MFKFSKKKIASIAVVLLILFGGAITAYAYWTTSGSGTGSASTGTSAAISAVRPRRSRAYARAAQPRR